MTLLSDFASSLRQSHRRHAARRDLGNLSAAQLADIGIEPDHIGEVVESMLARPKPFDPSARIKPEFGWCGLDHWRRLGSGTPC